VRRACALDLNVYATLGQETLELWASLWRFFVHVGILGEEVLKCCVRRRWTLTSSFGAKIAKAIASFY
jgi:hypothetical protein